MKIHVILVFIAFLLSGTINDDNPRIDPEEIIAPPVVFNNGMIWGGESFYENPDTIDCGGRDNCMEYVESLEESQ
jgi:hypothetical protein